MRHRRPGPIRRAEDERAALSEALQRGEEALARLERDRETHSAAIVRRLAADEGFAATREQLNQAELAVKLAGERQKQLTKKDGRFVVRLNRADLPVDATAEKPGYDAHTIRIDSLSTRKPPVVETATRIVPSRIDSTRTSDNPGWKCSVGGGVAGSTMATFRGSNGRPATTGIRITSK